MNEKIYLGTYSYKQCREMGIGLGLDLKGGMNVILEVSVPDVIKALADHKTDEAFVNAVNIANKQAANSNSDFITLFIKEYKNQKPDGTLAELFATQQLKDKVNTKSTDAEVEAVVRAEVDAAIVLANAGLSTMDDKSEVDIRFARVDDCVVVKLTQDLGDASMLKLTGMLVEAEAKKLALQEIAKAPKAIEALNTILDLGYDISVEYHDDDQGKIMAMPITRADLEAMSQE